MEIQVEGPPLTCGGALAAAGDGRQRYRVHPSHAGVPSRGCGISVAGRRPYVAFMAFEPHQPIPLPPLEIAEGTFVLRCAQSALGAPLSVSLNSMVILAAEPVVVDTGVIANRTVWFRDLTSIVDPATVRWVFLSHDDDDHTGNLAPLLEMCPQRPW
jgi:hypothetical protein